MNKTVFLLTLLFFLSLLACNSKKHLSVDLPETDLPLLGGSYFGKGVFDGRFYLDSVKLSSNVIYYANPKLDSNRVYQRRVIYNKKLSTFEFEDFKLTDFVFMKSLSQVFSNARIDKPIPFVSDSNLKWEVYNLKKNKE